MSNAALLPTTELASEDWQVVKEDGKKPVSLLVQLRTRAYILPYFRFVYAEGDNSLVKIAFASHLVTVTGSGLAALLVALASNVVVRIIQPTENEAKFGVRGPSASKHNGVAIHDISVEEPE
jgi:hypothetical protein